MKYKFIIFLLTLSIISKAQNSASRIGYSAGMINVFKDTLYKDTIPVFLLIGYNNITKPGGNVYNITGVWQMNGYEIREVNARGGCEPTVYAIYIPKPTYRHIEYLDENKKTMNDIIVWQAVPRTQTLNIQW